MINITLEEARELYKQGSLAKEIALRAFPKGEIVNDYKQVTSLPKEINCKTDRLYARLVTAYKQISEGRKVELTSKKCYLPEIVLAASTVPRCGEYKGKVVIDNKTFSIYIRTRTALFDGRVDFENDGVYCGAYVRNNYTIGPGSYVYDCEHILSPEKAIGKIKDGNLIINNERKCNICIDPYEIEKCCECEILPYCNGGCHHLRKSGKDFCPDEKNYISEFLKLYYKKYYAEAKE